MKKVLFFSIGFLVLISFRVFAQQWRDVAPGQTVMLPRDLYFRSDYRIQWWYLTGHLFTDEGREFGYELTFFAAGVQKKRSRSNFGVDTVYLAHFAISDVLNNRYYHYSDADAGAFGFAGADANRLHIWVDRYSLQGSIDKMHLKAQADDVAIDLLLVPTKPAVLNGEEGYSPKSEGSPLIASFYFSFTNMESQGVLKLNDALFRIKGKSWFDREISSRGLPKTEPGWDWFALQLDDGRDVMLYEIRKKDGTLDRYSSGSISYRDGRSRHLAMNDFTVTVLSHYKSERSGATFPSKWEVDIPSEKLRVLIIPLIQDQEFTAVDPLENSYWEGTCKIEGVVHGRAYVEMTGYDRMP